MASRPTSSGTRRLSEVARELVIPSGIVSTGWPAVRDKCRDLGIQFDEWQDGAGRLILGKRADGKLAVMVEGVGMSLPRQVGKTYLLAGLLFALSILRPGLLVIWTAHHLRTSDETFLAMQGFARRRKVAPYVRNVYKGSGDEAIIFQNGSRILFGARERGFGRGIPGVDVLMCDEAQILTDRALDNMLATVNTSDLGLVLYVGTPPRPEDPSESFTRMRNDALSGESTDMVWIECGADRGASPDDRKQWAKANPSYPHRTPVESILRLRKKLSLDSFMREGLGIWDEVSNVSPLDLSMWADRADPSSQTVGRVAFGLEVAPWGTSAAIAVGGRRADGLGHGEITSDGEVRDHRPGTAWVVPRLVELAKRHNPCVLTLNPRTESGSLIKALNEAGFVQEPIDGQWRLQLLGASEYAQACGGLVGDVRNDAWRHVNQGPLNEAAEGARPRKLAEAWAWSWKDSAVDISPLVAVTNARHGFASHGLEAEMVPFVLVGE